tara:strand:- start:1264 stop:1500 length:237 start_codon:yes stop_codon:yes gene_type:complete
LLTSRGRGVAVVQSLEEYEKNAEELGFLRAVYQGLEEARDGNTVSFEEAKKSIGIEVLSVQIDPSLTLPLEDKRGGDC